MLTENMDFLDRYHIQHRIGEGAFAEVWLATDENLKREVAIKAVRLSPGQHETKAAVDEAMTLIQFDHPNIIKLYDLVPPKEDDRFVYLIMEFADGGTLYDLLQRGKLTEEQIREITLQLCAGVEYAHQRGWMHRDLKPKNIFFCRGTTKIGDFGLARIVEDSYRSITASTGTVAYMAPEQFEKGYDKRVDLWALGVIVCEMFTGKQMFQGEAMQIMKQIGFDPIVIPDEIPEIWRPIIEKALQKDPNERYQTAEEFASVLKTSAQKQELLSKAKAAFDGKRYDEAVAFIQQGLAILPHDIDFEKIKGQLDARRKEIWRLTQQVNQQLMQDLDKAQGTLDRLLEIDPHSEHVKELQNQLAEALKSRGEQQVQEEPKKPETEVIVREPDIEQEKSNVKTMINEKDGSEMILIPAGEFLMGTTPEEARKLNELKDSEENEDYEYDKYYNYNFERETPQRRVYLDAYYIDKYPVTNAQYVQFLNDVRRKKSDEGEKYINLKYSRITRNIWGKYQVKSIYESNTVKWVSWYGARDYAAWAGKRLPTEAEWEKAARGTDGRVFPWGDEPGASRTSVSPYGVYNMFNESEWCADCYDETYYQKAPNSNPTGPEIPTGPRVLRGGYSLSDKVGKRCAYRDGRPPDYSMFSFRCARTPD